MEKCRICRIWDSERRKRLLPSVCVRFFRDKYGWPLTLFSTKLFLSDDVSESRRHPTFDSTLGHCSPQTTWWQQSLRWSQSELQARDALGLSGHREERTEQRTESGRIRTRVNDTSRPRFSAARWLINRHKDATLAKSLPAQGCEPVNYYGCSIITNHNLLGGPCIIYISMLKLMGYELPHNRNHLMCYITYNY